jgi:DNA gyrase/topoisomerase IV subunit A
MTIDPGEDPEFIRQQAIRRLGVLRAVIRAIDLGWPLIDAVESADSKAQALQRLAEAPFGFDPVHAVHILDLTLSRRTRQGRQLLAEEEAAAAALVDRL